MKTVMSLGDRARCMMQSNFCEPQKLLDIEQAPRHCRDVRYRTSTHHTIAGTFDIEQAPHHRRDVRYRTSTAPSQGRSISNKHRTIAGTFDIEQAPHHRRDVRYRTSTTLPRDLSPHPEFEILMDRRQAPSRTYS